MQTDSGAIEQLLSIYAQLLDPEHGCVWDKAQSFATLAPMLLNDRILLL